MRERAAELAAARAKIERQLELDLAAVKADEQNGGDLADRIRAMCLACPECGRRGYHLVTCSIGRSAT